MTESKKLLQQLKALDPATLLQNAIKERARRKMKYFIPYTMPTYSMQWFHEVLADKLDKFLFTDEIKRLMVFAPPQHGKSEICSRRFPAFALGNFPELKIAGCSYNSTLAANFNRSLQRVIDSQEYHDLFPETRLNEANIRTVARGNYLRNSEIFEIVGKEGFYKAAGVGSALTGTAVDIGIIDDPYKDAMEAYSETIRSSKWEWYESVFETRLHNASKILIILTRWHHDDLAGRLLKYAEDNPAGEQWDVVHFQALKEKQTTHEKDQRQYGEALWPDRHNKERLDQKRDKSPTTFQSLYQGNPTPEGGNMIKTDWFGWFGISDLQPGARVKFTGDGAFTEKETNDPTALLAYVYDGYYFNILDVGQVWYEMGELLEFIPEFIRRNDNTGQGIMKFEPKANGKSVVQMFKRPIFNRDGVRLPNVNIKESKPPTADKTARLMSQLDIWESGRIRLLKGAAWAENFMNEAISFPKGKHDDQIDAAMIMVSEEIPNYTKGQRGLPQYSNFKNRPYIEQQVTNNRPYLNRK